jgi:nitrate reductase beta subunit
MEYLASLMSAGDVGPIRKSLERLVAMRQYMRASNVDGEIKPEFATDVGMTPEELEDMFRMVAIADYDDRYVIPKRHGETSTTAFADQGSCGIDFDNGAAIPPGLGEMTGINAPDPVGGALAGGPFGDPVPGETRSEADPDFDVRDLLSKHGEGVRPSEN